jgi:hypothetical protein
VPHAVVDSCTVALSPIVFFTVFRQAGIDLGVYRGGGGVGGIRGPGGAIRGRGGGTAVRAPGGAGDTKVYGGPARARVGWRKPCKRRFIK